MTLIIDLEHHRGKLDRGEHLLIGTAPSCDATIQKEGFSRIELEIWEDKGKTYLMHRGDGFLLLPGKRGATLLPKNIATELQSERAYSLGHDKDIIQVKFHERARREQTIIDLSQPRIQLIIQRRPATIGRLPEPQVDISMTHTGAEGKLSRKMLEVTSKAGKINVKHVGMNVFTHLNSGKTIAPGETFEPLEDDRYQLANLIFSFKLPAKPLPDTPIAGQKPAARAKPIEPGPPKPPSAASPDQVAFTKEQMRRMLKNCTEHFQQKLHDACQKLASPDPDTRGAGTKELRSALYDSYHYTSPLPFKGNYSDTAFRLLPIFKNTKTDRYHFTDQVARGWAYLYALPLGRRWYTMDDFVDEQGLRGERLKTMRIYLDIPPEHLDILPAICKEYLEHKSEKHYFQLKYGYEDKDLLRADRIVLYVQYTGDISGTVSLFTRILRKYANKLGKTTPLFTTELVPGAGLAFTPRQARNSLWNYAKNVLGYTPMRLLQLRFDEYLRTFGGYHAALAALLLLDYTQSEGKDCLSVFTDPAVREDFLAKKAPLASSMRQADIQP